MVNVMQQVAVTTITTAEAARLARTTPDQLVHWVTLDIIDPAYTPDGLFHWDSTTLAAAAAVAELAHQACWDSIDTEDRQNTAKAVAALVTNDPYRLQGGADIIVVVDLPDPTMRWHADPTPTRPTPVTIPAAALAAAWAAPAPPGR